MAQSFRTNLGNVAVKYLQHLKVPVTKTTLLESLEQNPYYPSLYSLSNVFTRFKIDNQAFEIDNEKLEKLEPPFIAYLNIQGKGKDFVLVTKLTATQVSYLTESSKITTMGKEEFLKNFQKIIFVAEGSEQSGERDYLKSLDKEKKIRNKNNTLIWGSTLLLLLTLFQFFNSLTTGFLSPALVVFTKLSGLVITILLLVYETDKTNSFVKSICSVGKQTNCHAVLNSKGGKIFGMTWSEIGFFYFAATALFLLLPGITYVSKLPWLATGSIIAAPYILFSIFYQWKIVKQWCTLCLAVQAILLMEFCWAIYNVQAMQIFAKPFLIWAGAIMMISAIIFPSGPVIGTHKKLFV